MIRRLALLLALVLAVAACGEPAEEEASTDSTAPAAEAGPVAIEHAFGTTELGAPPERIVSLDTQWTDVLVAMGHEPAAYLVDPNVEGDLPWREGHLADAERLEATTELPFEAVAAQDPDLIVVTYLAPNQADYEALSAIAPTIASLNTDRVDTWQDLTAVAGEVFGEQEAAEELVASVDEEVATVAEALPGLDGKTVAMANYVPGDGIYVVADPDDGANLLFADLGMSLPPTILEQPGVDVGRVELSFEQIGLLDADLLVLLLNGAETDDISGYDSLPAVQTGAVSILDYATITGLNTPSPLSIPHALDAIRPALEAAAAA